MFSKYLTLILHLDDLTMKVGMGEPTCGRGAAVNPTMHKMKAGGSGAGTQLCSEGRAWPGTCPAKAPYSSCSCHAILREVRTSVRLMG